MDKFFRFGAYGLAAAAAAMSMAGPSRYENNDPYSRKGKGKRPKFDKRSAVKQARIQKHRST